MNNKTIISAVVVILVVLGGGWYLLSHKSAPVADKTAQTSGSDVVATVNGDNITRAELDAVFAQAGATTTEAKAQVQTQALDSLINQKLLSQAFTKSGITASSTAVEAELSKTKSQFKTADEYQKALSAQGLTEDALRTRISQTLSMQAFLDKELSLSKVTATADEIKTAYDQASANQKDLPALKDIKSQVEQFVIQQKQQKLIDDYVAKLRTAAEVKILI